MAQMWIILQATLVVLMALVVAAEVVNDNTLNTDGASSPGANLSRSARCLGCYEDRSRSARFFDFDWLRRGNYGTNNYYDRSASWYRPAYGYDDLYRGRGDSYYGDRYYGRSNYYDYNYRGNGYDNLSPYYNDQYRDFGYNNYYRSMDRDRIGLDYRNYRPYDETYRGSSGFDIQTGKGHYFAKPPPGSHQPAAHSSTDDHHHHHHNDHPQQHPSQNSFQSDSYLNHRIPFEDSAEHTQHSTTQEQNYSSQDHYNHPPHNQDDSYNKDHSQESAEGGSRHSSEFNHIHKQQLPDLNIANPFNEIHDSHSATSQSNE